SCADFSFSSRMSLSVSAILPCTPVNSIGMRTPKSPFFMAASVRKSSFSKSLDENSVALSIPIPVVIARVSVSEVKKQQRGWRDATAAPADEAAFLLIFPVEDRRLACPGQARAPVLHWTRIDVH